VDPSAVGKVEFTAADAQLRQHASAMAQQRDRELAGEKLREPCCKALVSLNEHWSGLTLCEIRSAASLTPTLPDALGCPYSRHDVLPVNSRKQTNVPHWLSMLRQYFHTFGEYLRTFRRKSLPAKSLASMLALLRETRVEHNNQNRSALGLSLR
jgi:hypothetical protein